MVNLEGIIWELSLDGLRHLEQALLEEAPMEARNNPASYVLDFKPSTPPCDKCNRTPTKNSWRSN
jgi:hypothetical protein